MNELEQLNEEISNRAAGLNLDYEVHQQKLTALADEKIERLADLVQAAEDDKAAADALEATAAGDSTAWLTSDELAAATARQAFVMEDLQAADPDEMISRINQAIAANDKPLLWLYRRYSAERWQQYEPGKLGLTLPIEYRRAMTAVNAAVIPEKIRTAKEDAHKMRLDAEKRRVAAGAALWNAEGRKGSYNPFADPSQRPGGKRRV